MTFPARQYTTNGERRSLRCYAPPTARPARKTRCVIASSTPTVASRLTPESSPSSQVVGLSPSDWYDTVPGEARAQAASLRFNRAAPSRHECCCIDE